ncbi:MAG: tRNA glutamyl-Q(34) synthetase GluQRS [Hyphomicrobiaceae bacterium]
MTSNTAVQTTRFAPSPNGALHLGHALSAIVGFDWAQRNSGRFLVRIEDIDVSRSREEFVATILDDLSWLGLSWAEAPLRQSSNFPAYATAAHELERMGLLYPCFATRGEIASAIAQLGATGGVVERDPDGTPLYPGLHRGMAASEVERRRRQGERSAMRLDMERALAAARAKLEGRPLDYLEAAEDGASRRVLANPALWGDAVIVRKDTPASYHLAVVVDDAAQGVTRVTRGRDLEAATGLHRLLQVLLGLPEPTYHHHRLVLDDDGRKLSKSDGAVALSALRAAGVSPQEVRTMLDLPPAPG